jgi:hypothetical protein
MLPLLILEETCKMIYIISEETLEWVIHDLLGIEK